MFEMPPLSDTALVLTVVGATFLVRFLLMVRRLRDAAGRGHVPLRTEAGRVTTPRSFGPDLEPERRHALRQFTLGALVAAAGLVLALAAAVFGTEAVRP